MSSHDLASLGWNAFFESHRQHIPAAHQVGRVSSHHGEELGVLWQQGELTARLGGRLRHSATSATHLPAVGDWVALRIADHHRAVISAVLPRASVLARKAAGRTSETQIIAANVDIVGVVVALDEPLNARRIERYVSVVQSGGATALLVLSKADLHEDAAAAANHARTMAPGTPVVALSSISGEGLEGISDRCRDGLTLALVGMSGAGKSSLVNALLGADVQRTGAVREHDHRGRHVTTHRELFVLPTGGLLLDTPGMRELAAWAGDADSPSGFDELDPASTGCRFRDCRHDGEPDCAVTEAIASGQCDAGRLASHRKLQRELAHEASRHDVRVRQAATARWKAIHKSMRGFTKEGR